VKISFLNNIFNLQRTLNFNQFSSQSHLTALGKTVPLSV